jgi:tetratricopeptide (TPR) repeat protein
VTRNPDLADGHRTLGAALYRRQQFAEARGELQKALELKTSKPALCWYLLAAIAHDDGQKDEAQEHLQRARTDHELNHVGDVDHSDLAVEFTFLLK